MIESLENKTEHKAPINQIGKGISLSYIKSNLAIGGASVADLHMLRLFEETGLQTKIIAGAISSDIQSWISRNLKASVEIRRPLKSTGDQKDILPGRIYDELSEASEGSDILLFSQQFNGKTPQFAEALARLEKPNSWHRVHDKIRSIEDFAQLHSPETVIFPTTEILKRQIEDINRLVDIVVIPPCIDTDGLQAATSKEAIREAHGYKT